MKHTNSILDAWFRTERATYDPGDESAGFRTIFAGIWMAIGLLSVILFANMLAFTISIAAATLVLTKTTVSEWDTKLMKILALSVVAIWFGRIIIVAGMFPIALAVFIGAVLAIVWRVE